MTGKAGTKRGLFAVGATVLMVVGLFAAFAGSASAAPVAPTVATHAAWAYGGTNTTSGNLSLGKLNATWTTTISVAVIFNATPTVKNTTELEVQRTVGVTIQITASSPEGTLTFDFHAMEADKAYANITNASTVYIAGTPVPALGIDNASFHGTASLSESLVAKGVTGVQVSGYLNVSALANAKVQFDPALGLIPLNLTGVTEWNSTATAHPSADWKFAYNYALHGLNDTSASGNATHSGTWSTSGPVNVNGQVFTSGLPRFTDHAKRVGVQLTVAGPANIYDGFIVLPRGYDIFGGAKQQYSSDSMSNVTISGERLFLDRGHVRVSSLTAAQVRVGGEQGKQPLAAATGLTSLVPAANAVGGAVVAQPETVSAAQSQSHCIEFGCGAAAPWFSGLVALAVIGGLIAAVAGTVGVVEWRSYARRKNQARKLVGGYSEGLASGFPPAVGPSTIPAPQAPMAGPTNDIVGPGRQP